MNLIKKTNMYHIINITIPIGILIALIIWIQHDRKVLIKDIKQNPSYSIGTIIKFDKGHGGGGGVRIHISNSSPFARISFYAGDSLIEDFAKGSIRADRDYTGEKFIIVYNKMKPTQCMILFDYPIRDSADFARYMEKFKTNPPNIEYFPR